MFSEFFDALDTGEPATVINHVALFQRVWLQWLVRICHLHYLESTTEARYECTG
jgi:hypothetical protein